MAITTNNSISSDADYQNNESSLASSLVQQHRPITTFVTNRTKTTTTNSSSNTIIENITTENRTNNNSLLQQQQSSTTTDNPPFYWSACMIIKGEDMALPEWLAYHITVLPLRRFILGLDPESKTHPDYILKEYAKYNLNYTVWEYDDYIHFREGRKKALSHRYNYSHYPNETVITDTVLLYYSHLHRQNLFYAQCLSTLREENTTEWTLMLDADEYLVYNPYKVEEKPTTICKAGRKRGKEWRKECINEYHQRMSNSTSTNMRHRVPRTVRGPGNSNSTSASFTGGTLLWTNEQQLLLNVSSSPQTMAHYLHQYMDKLIQFKPGYRLPCWGMQRNSIGAYEPQHDHQPEGLSEDQQYLYTLRYRLHTQFPLSPMAKCMVNLRRYQNRTIKNFGNPHAPVDKRLCYNAPYSEMEDAIFSVYHYRSSLEHFLIKQGQYNYVTKDVAEGQFYRRQISSRSEAQYLRETWDATWWWTQFVRIIVGNNVTEAKRLTVGLQQIAKEKYMDILQRKNNNSWWSSATDNESNNNNTLIVSLPSEPIFQV